MPFDCISARRSIVLYSSVQRVAEWEESGSHFAPALETAAEELTIIRDRRVRVKTVLPSLVAETALGLTDLERAEQTIVSVFYALRMFQFQLVNQSIMKEEKKTDLHLSLHVLKGSFMRQREKRVKN